jgi:hypothetical protein
MISGKVNAGQKFQTSGNRMEKKQGKESYSGFELGPIRPPSEASSLLLRITRNCPWNKCKFCGLYRGEKFNVRPVEHLIADIDTIKSFVDQLQQVMLKPGASSRDLLALQTGLAYQDQLAFHSALSWLRGGMKSVFLQDANSLVIKPTDLIALLEYLRQTFPQIERVTSYARSHSVARIADEDLARMARAGLNRIHIGMESAADPVLEFINKGVDKQTHILAGQKVKRAGIELSEYFMPGLGGQRWTKENALETADALNQIDPDFIRIRTLAIPESVDLYQDVHDGSFIPLGDIDKAKELLLLLENLEGVSSTVKSDHILNLFQEVEGKLPEDKDLLAQPIRDFLALDAEQQLLFLVGRRCGIFSGLTDLNDTELRRHAEKALTAHRVTWNTYDEWAAGLVRQFI